jgi:DNA-binding HxlR family transcriptional regulator
MPRPLSLSGQRALQSRDAIELLSNKWRVTILHVLSFGPLRANELQRAMQPISAKVLTQTLRGMERDGLIDRRVQTVVPARVEYSMTAMGAEVVPLLKPLCLWAESHSAQRDQARTTYDRRARSSAAARRKP